MTARDAARTWWLRSRRLPVDDAYIEWFNAHTRSHAHCAWNAAGPRVRRAAYRAYLTELEVEEAAARRLERLRPRFAAA